MWAGVKGCSHRSLDVFSDSGLPRCCVPDLISAILCGENNFIDTTENTGKEGREGSTWDKFMN